MRGEVWGRNGEEEDFSSGFCEGLEGGYDGRLVGGGGDFEEGDAVDGGWVRHGVVTVGLCLGFGRVKGRDDGVEGRGTGDVIFGESVMVGLQIYINMNHCML